MNVIIKLKDEQFCVISNDHLTIISNQSSLISGHQPRWSWNMHRRS